MSNNTTTPPVFVYPDIDFYGMFNPEWKIRYFSILSAIMTVICIIENAVVLFIIVGKLGLKKNVNFLVFSLALNDVIHIGVVLTSSSADYFSRGENNGVTYCKLLAVAKVAVINVSVLTHAVIAIERLRCLQKKVDNGLQPLITYIAVPVVWVYSWACSSPMGVWTEMHPLVRSCMLCPTCSDAVRTFANVNGGVNLIAPIFMMIIIYICVAGSVRKQRVGSSFENDTGMSWDWNNYIPVTRFCAVIMALLVVTALPLQINNIIFAVSNDPELPLDMLPYTWLIAFLGVCLQPVAYSILWPSFKEELLKMFFCRK